MRCRSGGAIIVALSTCTALNHCWIMMLNHSKHNVVPATWTSIVSTSWLPNSHLPFSTILGQNWKRMCWRNKIPRFRLSLSLSLSLYLSLHRHLQWAVIWQRRECSYVASSEVPLNTRLTVRSQCLMHLQKGLPASIMWDHVISWVAMADFSISFPAFHIFWLVVSTYPSEKWWSE